MINVVKSKFGANIRLTEERWMHITSSHPEINLGKYDSVLNAVKNPDFIFNGDTGEFLAVKKITRKEAWIVVPYKESQDNGFIITAYITTDWRWLFKREVIWSKK